MRADAERTVMTKPPAIGHADGMRETVLHQYTDPVEGHVGYLAFDGRANPLAAGGLRVDRHLTGETTVQLAQVMTQKQRFLGLGVDGAKCGLARDPASPGTGQAIRRFLRFLKPHLLDRFSMGPDMGTDWQQIEASAAAEGIPSVKIAIARAQGLPFEEFARRLQLLDADVDGMSLGARRAGHALATAVLGTLDHLGRAPAGARVALQGFGTLGRAAAKSLDEAGCRLVAVADEHGSVTALDGLDVPALLRLPARAPVTVAQPDQAAERTQLLRAPADLLVLAAHEDALGEPAIAAVAEAVPAVVVGANLGLSGAAERRLAEHGVTVVPDFVGGCGGPASMDALFGPPATPSAPEVLHRAGDVVRCRVRQVLAGAARRGVEPRQAARNMVPQGPRSGRVRPYGRPLPDGGGAP